MAAPDSGPESVPMDDPASRRVGWIGLGVAAGSFVGSLFASTVLGVTYALTRGLDQDAAQRDFGFSIASAVGLWFGFLVLPLLWARAAHRSGEPWARAAHRSGEPWARAAHRSGEPWAQASGARPGGQGRSLGLSIRLIDLPIGLAVGLASAVVTVLVSSAVLTTRQADALEAKAELVVDRAHGPVAVVILVVALCVATPLAEEVFFRGLVFGSLRRATSLLVALPVAGLAFGPVHYDGLSTPGRVLAVQFGLLGLFGVALCALAARTGRLGAGIVSHAVFNAVTVVTLLVQR